MSGAMVVHSVGDLKEIATAMHASGLYKFTNPNQYLALMFKAQAEGRHPATVVEDYHFFNGRAGLKAEAALARHLESEGSVRWIRNDAEVCEAEFSHPKGGKYVSKFTVEDAKRIGLMNKEVWKHYTEDMLRARVIARGCRAVNPGVFRGMRVAEEMQDDPIESVTPAVAVAAPAAPAIPRASEVAAQEGEFTEAPKAAEEAPAPAAPASPPPAAPKAAPAAPKAPPAPAHPTNSTYLKEVPTQVMHRDDPSVGKVRYGITLSIGLVGTYSKEAAEAAAAAAASKTMIELAYTVADIGGGKTRNELVWFNGKAIAG